MATRNIIHDLQTTKGLMVECPHCEDTIPIKRMTLFSMSGGYPKAAQKQMQERLDSVQQLKNDLRERKQELELNKSRKPDKVTVATESTNFGQISEQIIPAFNGFPYNPIECRALFKPVDYILFNQLSKGRVESITFVDVKTGKAKLSASQKAIQSCIATNNIKHEVI